MKTLRELTHAERVDSWSTALMILLVVHSCIGAVAVALQGTVSLLCGLAAAAGYIFGRRRLRQCRVSGRAAVAWTVLRTFETAAVALLVFLLGQMIGDVMAGDVAGYVIGAVLGIGFAVYRTAAWARKCT